MGDNSLGFEVLSVLICSDGGKYVPRISIFCVGWQRDNDFVGVQEDVCSFLEESMLALSH